MSTTHIQPLPNVRGRMSYTELGEGKKRTRNIREKTNRIAAQMGDMGTREDFIRFCSAMRRQSQGTRLNEGYELRVSWSPEELSKDSPEDIQRACEYGYALCKEVARTPPAGSRSTLTARAAACTSMRPSRTMIWYPARPSRTAPTTRP